MSMMGGEAGSEAM